MKQGKRASKLLLVFTTLGMWLWKPVDTGLEISVSKGEGTYLVRVRDTRGGLKEAVIYKGGRKFVRAYESKVNGGRTDRGYVTFIFDDGWLDVFASVYPIFKKYDMAATVGVIKAYEDRPGALSSRQIKRLIDSGWDVAVHSITDTPLTELSLGEAEEEMTVSKMFIWDKFWGPEYFLYPHGDVNREVEQLAREYFDSARGYEEGVNEIPLADAFDIKIKSLEKYATLPEMKFLIDVAAKEKMWLVLVGHHVSDEDLGQYTISPALLEGMVAHAHASEVEVVTLGRALQELGQDMALVKNGEVVWEFDDDLLPAGTAIYAEVKGRRTREVWLP